MKRILTAILLGASALPAQAERLTTLLEERVLAEVGHQIPAEAEIDIRVANSTRTEALLVSQFWFDPPSQRYVADITTEDGDAIRIQGVAMITVPTPVPTRRMMAGEIISESDLQTVNLPHMQVAAFAILDEDRLVGMEASRMLAQGRPVPEQSIRAPLVIDRGEKVEIRYSNGTMSLTAPGKALGNAAKGEDVRVVNLVSNKTVVGRAAQDGIVEIQN